MRAWPWATYPRRVVNPGVWIGAWLFLSTGLFAIAQQSNPIQESTATIAEQYLLAAANQERAALGLPQLHRDVRLAGSAAQHAREMASHEAISHQFSGEAELTQRGASAGLHFSVISENVGEAPGVVQIHDMWMHSEHHRTNLLDPAIDAVGISVIARGRELYAVEDFARTVKPASLEDQEAQPGSMVVDLNRETVSAARQTCILPTGYAGMRKPGFVMRFSSDSLTQLPGQLKTRLDSGHYSEAAIGACNIRQSPFTSYSFAVLLYP
jgi:hypothetical protein